jgi:DNA-binding MarR family transcriptional regulator
VQSSIRPRPSLDAGLAAVSADERPEPRPRLSYALARLERALRKELDERLRARGLTIPQFTALSILSSRGELSNAQLARRCYVTPQSMSEVILALERDGLIHRSPDRANRRILRTVLTAKGRETLAACDAEVSDAEEQAFAHLPTTARRRFTREIVDAVHNLGAGF